jgi:hypothetical protein
MSGRTGICAAGPWRCREMGFGEDVTTTQFQRQEKLFLPNKHLKALN